MSILAFFCYFINYLLLLGALDFFVDEVDDYGERYEDEEFHGDEAALIVLELMHLRCIMPKSGLRMQV